MAQTDKLKLNRIGQLRLGVATVIYNCKYMTIKDASKQHVSNIYLKYDRMILIILVHLYGIKDFILFSASQRGP